MGKIMGPCYWVYAKAQRKKQNKPKVWYFRKLYCLAQYLLSQIPIQSGFHDICQTQIIRMKIIRTIGAFSKVFVLWIFEWVSRKLTFSNESPHPFTVPFNSHWKIQLQSSQQNKTHRDTKHLHKNTISISI